MLAQGNKRIADAVNDGIVAGVLGLAGLPQPSAMAVVRAAVDAFRQRLPATSINCLVREIVNGAVKAATFTRTPTTETARATMEGVVQGARATGLDLPPVAALACERILWSGAALGEPLAPCARAAVEGVKRASAPAAQVGQGVMEQVIVSAIQAVQAIDPAQVAEVRREIAGVVGQAALSAPDGAITRNARGTTQNS